VNGDDLDDHFSNTGPQARNQPDEVDPSKKLGVSLDTPQICGAMLWLKNKNTKKISQKTRYLSQRSVFI
jgi:hypothetical protein